MRTHANPLGLNVAPTRGLGRTTDAEAPTHTARARNDVAPLATPRAGPGSTQQAFQASARAASMGAGAPVGALSSGFDPLSSNGLAGPERGGASGGGGGYFEDKVMSLMINVVEDMQKKIEQRLQKLQSEAQAAEAAAAAGGKDTGGESRNIEFEKIKFDMQKLSQMQQAMSNVLNSMDELAKSAIRKIATT